jgi:hypothetical protein
MRIKGRVVFEDIEGGIWGIRDDTGQAYLPVDGIPTRFRTAGQRIRAEIEPVDLFSSAMWGRTVRLHSIEKA